MANTRFAERIVLMLAVFTLALGMAACGVNVKEKDNGNGNKDVTIQSPVGNLHVGEDVQGADTGMTVYPGAKLVEKDDDGGSDRANINISTAIFGLKLVIVKYLSDDSPQKLVEFYTNDLKRYGKVLQCKKSRTGGDWHVGVDSHDKPNQSKELTCGGDGKGDTIELKVGTSSNQHVVAVSPKGKGAEFALVYVRTHSDNDSTI